MLPAILREVDHVVLMPRCSRHVLAGSTLALKSAVGWWRHDARLKYHHNAATFSEKTADANTVPTILAKQRLVLTSATRVLTTSAPTTASSTSRHRPRLHKPLAVAHDMLSLAWLLEGRAATAEGRRTGPLDDPNESTMFVNFANRIVTAWLGGIGEAMRMERLTRYDMATIWDDRVLRARVRARPAACRGWSCAAVNDGVPGRAAPGPRETPDPGCDVRCRSVRSSPRCWCSRPRRRPLQPPRAPSSLVDDEPLPRTHRARARLWARADEVNQGQYATYQSRTSRVIPVVVLEPR